MNISKRQELGFHRNNKRLWLNHGTITSANLKAGDQIIHIYNDQSGELIIEKIASDKVKDQKVRVVVETAKGCVIDTANKDFSAFFKDFEAVDVIPDHERIIIKGNHAESLIKEREASVLRRVKTGQPIRSGGACVGMGLLCQSVHEGIKQSGVNIQQRFANEINPIAAEVNLAGNEIWKDACNDAVFIIDDIYKLNMALVPKLDLLVIGSPCPLFSKLNTKLGKSRKKDIFHPDAGTIFQPLLELIKKSNPAVVLLENSVFFANSIFDYIMSDVMRRFGFKQVSTTVKGSEFGDFEIRKRMCRVWYSEGLSQPNMEDLPFKMSNRKTFGEVLEPIALDDKRWGRRKYLEKKDAESHNGHRYCITPFSATTIPTCSANYYKIQPDSAMILHPERKMVTRIMTSSEHCNMRDVQGALKENVVAVEKGEHYAQESDRTNATEAQKMLGNSVSPKPWFSSGYRIGEWLLEMANRKCNVSNIKQDSDSKMTQAELFPIQESLDNQNTKSHI